MSWKIVKLRAGDIVPHGEHGATFRGIVVIREMAPLRADSPMGGGAMQDVPYLFYEVECAEEPKP